jgi:hypothetical protein
MITRTYEHWCSQESNPTMYLRTDISIQVIARNGTSAERRKVNEFMYLCSFFLSVSHACVCTTERVNCGNCAQNCVKPHRDDKQKTSDEAEFSIFEMEITIVT